MSYGLKTGSLGIVMLFMCKHLVTIVDSLLSFDFFNILTFTLSISAIFLLPIIDSVSPLFSSHKLKALASFSDRRLSVRLSVGKLFTFSFSTQEPLGQFQLNFLRSIIG